jgi:hypothetical protein
MMTIGLERPMETMMGSEMPMGWQILTMMGSEMPMG